MQLDVECCEVWEIDSVEEVTCAGRRLIPKFEAPDNVHEADECVWLVVDLSCSKLPQIVDVGVLPKREPLDLQGILCVGVVVVPEVVRGLSLEDSQSVVESLPWPRDSSMEVAVCRDSVTRP